MLQVESDASFLFLAADNSAVHTDKSYSSSASTSPVRAHMSGSNQWQPPAWHPHHARHVLPPSSAHLSSPYAPSNPSQSRSVNSSPVSASHNHPYGQEDQRYGYSSSGYAQDTYQDQARDDYYSSGSQWSYAPSSHGQHHQPQPQGGVYGKPGSDSIGVGLDPLPLRHLAVHPTVSNVNNNGTVDDELYEAHMLQEALTTPHYTRAHLGGFHHPHQLPSHVQQHHQPVQGPPYSSPFVSAVLDASAPIHHHSSALGGLQMMRQSSTATITSSVPSDSDGSDLKSSTGKRKRRGESAPRLCRVDGCTKGIRSRGLCKAHGGGRRCMTPGCTTSDQGGGHCVLHGGGRRCTIEGCTKSAQWKGLCKMHGGARRCRYENCTKNGQVKAGYCRAHHNLISKQREQGLITA